MFEKIHKFMKTGRINRVVDLTIKSKNKKGKKKNGYAKTS